MFSLGQKCTLKIGFRGLQGYKIYSPLEANENIIPNKLWSSCFWRYWGWKQKAWLQSQSLLSAHFLCRSFSPPPLFRSLWQGCRGIFTSALRLASHLVHSSCGPPLPVKTNNAENKDKSLFFLFIYFFILPREAIISSAALSFPFQGSHETLWSDGLSGSCSTLFPVSSDGINSSKFVCENSLMPSCFFWHRKIYWFQVMTFHGFLQA